MCGIAGYINTQLGTEDTIRRMCDQMVHRGPDAYGSYHDEKSGLWMGHRRLSIQDLSPNGAQPMTSHDGRYVIVFNGEIYNAGILKKKLQEKDTRYQGADGFRGTSDTEYLLEAIACLGLDETLRIIKGMFAIALYDKETRSITLIRDRAGEKPLYYGYVEGKFIFGSEIAVLEAYPGVKDKRRISREAIAEYMRYGYIPAPFSIYEGIYKLLPGTYLTLQAPYQEEKVTTYWSMREAAIEGEAHPFDGTFGEAVDELEKLLTKAIEGQMISDVPLGAFLSGGIDSPLIVSLMQKLSDRPVSTFSMGFDDPKYNEAQFAKEIAAHLGTQHTEMYVSEKDLLDALPKMGSIFSEPFADSSQIPTYLVSQLAKQKVTVSLSGDAGDELFYGYNSYAKIMEVYLKARKIPGCMKSCGGKLLASSHSARNFRNGKSLQAKSIIALHEAVCYHTNYYSEHCVLDKNGKLMKNVIYDRNVLLAPEEGAILQDIESNMLLKDILCYHPDDILVKVDRCGMAVSLENRIPMLDRDVLEFAWRLPVGWKNGSAVSAQERLLLLDGMDTSYNATKAVLRAILYKYVPRKMLDRPKKGFSVPLVKWMTEGKSAEHMKEVLGSSKLVQDGILLASAVEAMQQELIREKKTAQMVWQLLMLEEWYRQRF